MCFSTFTRYGLRTLWVLASLALVVGCGSQTIDPRDPIHDGQIRKFLTYGSAPRIISALVPGPTTGQFVICFHDLSGGSATPTAAAVKGWTTSAVQAWFDAIPSSLGFSWYVRLPITTQTPSSNPANACDNPSSLDVYYRDGSQTSTSSNTQINFYSHRASGTPITWGTALHEMGHVMGLDDTYDSGTPTTGLCTQRPDGTRHPASVMCGYDASLTPMYLLNNSSLALYADDKLGAKCRYCAGGPFGGMIPDGCKQLLGMMSGYTNQCSDLNL